MTPSERTVRIFVHLRPTDRDEALVCPLPSVRALRRPCATCRKLWLKLDVHTHTYYITHTRITYLWGGAAESFGAPSSSDWLLLCVWAAYCVNAAEYVGAAMASCSVWIVQAQTR